MPLPLLLNKRDTDGECRGVGGEGHKDWPTTFCFPRYHPVEQGGKQALPCNVPYGQPEDRAQMARQLQVGSLKPCDKQSSLAWYWRGDRRIKPCSRDTYRPSRKQSPRSDLSPVPAKPGPSVLWTFSGAKEGKV